MLAPWRRLPSPAPEGELVGRAQRGDDAAFEELIGATQGRLYTLAARLLQSRAEAQDVVQEAYIAAYTHLAELDAGRSPLPWLSTVTTRLCLNRLRSLKRLAGAQAEVVLEDSAPDRVALQEALASLSDEGRAVILLHYWGGYSCKEIGEMLDRGESAVKVQLFRSRERLRQWYKR